MLNILIVTSSLPNAIVLSEELACEAEDQKVEINVDHILYLRDTKVEEARRDPANKNVRLNELRVVAAGITKPEEYDVIITDSTILGYARGAGDTGIHKVPLNLGHLSATRRVPVKMFRVHNGHLSPGAGVSIAKDALKIATKRNARRRA